MILSVLSPTDSDFAGLVFSETHGHPFYLMETLKDLLERRALHPKQYRDNQWVFEVDAEHDLGQAVRVPSTVRAVIRSRLSRLSPNAFTLLAAAAILEQRLTFEHLCTIANISQDVGLSALDEVVSGRLLWEARQSDSASMYDFANDMIRDVVYTEAGDARRRLFHQRAMDLLELSKDSAAVLAHHAVAAGLAEAAFLHSLTAGQEALRLAAASEAQVHLEKARQLADEGSLTSIESRSHIRDLYLRLSEAYEMSGQSEKAQSVIDELQRLSLQ
jgi:predicted ATPase